MISTRKAGPTAIAGRAGGGSGSRAWWVSTAIATISGLFLLITLFSVWFLVGRARNRVLAVRSVAVLDALRGAAVGPGVAGGTDAKRPAVYVLDPSDGWVVALGLSGEPVLRWHVSGDGQADLARPADIATGVDGFVYVLDAGTGFVSKYDAQGRPQGRLLGPEAGVYEPKGLTVDEAGTVFVADTGTSRVLRVEPSGTVTAIGRQGRDRDGLWEPIGIRCGEPGWLYVADSGNGRIKKLDTDGRTVALWKLPGNPAYLALDGRGRIFATSPSSGCVFALSPDDGAVAYVGTSTTERIQFQRPLGVNFVGGRLYVTDGGEIRVYEPASR